MLRRIDRFDQYMEYKSLNDNKVTIELDLSTGLIGKSRKPGRDLSDRVVEKILNHYSDLDRVWLLTGEGNMLVDNDNDVTTVDLNENLIPFYDSVTSIGGINEYGADMSGVVVPTDFIDAGDWFREATAAIRHYGDSMIEYPSGCILAIKEVYDKRYLIPGNDYVIETPEYRVTKRIQRGHDNEHITAYSTNMDKYEDGRLVHEPFEIHLSSIRRISLVLGYIVKNN